MGRAARGLDQKLNRLAGSERDVKALVADTVGRLRNIQIVAGHELLQVGCR